MPDIVVITQAGLGALKRIEIMQTKPKSKTKSKKVDFSMLLHNEAIKNKFIELMTEEQKKEIEKYYDLIEGEGAVQHVYLNVKSKLEKVCELLSDSIFEIHFTEELKLINVHASFKVAIAAAKKLQVYFKQRKLRILADTIDGITCISVASEEIV